MLKLSETELRGHQHRWRECLCDELLEFDPGRAALINSAATATGP
jgi:hypothetical protein